MFIAQTLSNTGILLDAHWINLVTREACLMLIGQTLSNAGILLDVHCTNIVTREARLMLIGQTGYAESCLMFIGQTCRKNMKCPPHALANHNEIILLPLLKT